MVKQNEMILLADIGATNVRFAMLEKGNIHEIRAYESAQFPSLLEAIKAYHHDISKKSESALFSVACPIFPEQDLIQMTNFDWRFSLQELKTAFSWQDLKAVNDFHAVALSVLPLRNEKNSNHIRVIREGQPNKENHPVAVLGPGTGLGMAYLTHNGVSYQPHSTEGSHVTAPAQSQREFDIFQAILKLNPHFSHLSVERIASGEGIVNLYQAIAHLEKKPALFKEAADISHAALHHKCPMAEEALDLFCYFLGVAAGNQALTLNAQGGVFIAGGILPRFQEYFLKSRFFDGFLNKGRFRMMLEPIPLYLMTHPYPAFEGLKSLLSE